MEFEVDAVKQGSLMSGSSATSRFNVAKLEVKADSIEAQATTHPTWFGFGANRFIETVLTAYNNHIPLTFSPDDIWTVFLQSVAKFIEHNAEAVRGHFVKHEGKKELLVRSDFAKGSPSNDWPSAFRIFSERIKEDLGKKHALLTPTFSTTTPTVQTVHHVQLMGAMSPYYAYRMMTLCGIPKVTLTGTVEDWVKLHERVEACGEFMPKWTTTAATYVTSNFVAAAYGNPNLRFWQNLIKTRSGSGGTPVGGLINGLFPFVEGYNFNRVITSGYPDNVMNASGKSLGPAIDSGDYNSSFMEVPMRWDYLGHTYNMKLIAGVVGYAEDKTSLSPVLGWAVGEAK